MARHPIRSAALSDADLAGPSSATSTRSSVVAIEAVQPEFGSRQPRLRLFLDTTLNTATLVSQIRR
jgi:hypothetical protein